MEKVTSVETNINVTRGQQEKWLDMKIVAAYCYVSVTGR